MENLGLWKMGECEGNFIMVHSNSKFQWSVLVRCMCQLFVLEQVPPRLEAFRRVENFLHDFTNILIIIESAIWISLEFM